MSSGGAHQAPEGRFPVNSQFHVLLVEDDLLTLRTVEVLLRRCGYAVTTASNGREAIDILEGKHGGRAVDIILTDVLMPEVSGMDLINAVVHENRWNNVPVIVMSSQESQECVLEAFQAGASDYLIKPVRRNELTTLWQHVWKLNRTRSQEAARDQNASRPSTSNEAQHTAHLASDGAAMESSAPHNHSYPVLPSAASGFTHQVTPLAVHIDASDLADKPTSSTANEGAGPSSSEAESPKPEGSADSMSDPPGTVPERQQSLPSISPGAPAQLDGERASAVPAATTAATASQPGAHHPTSHPGPQQRHSPTKPHAESISPSRSFGHIPHLPLALQELADLGHRRQQEREKQQHLTRLASGDHGDQTTLQHCESSSAFTAFTVFLPQSNLPSPSAPHEAAEARAAPNTGAAAAADYAPSTAVDANGVSMGYPVQNPPLHSGFYLGQPSHAPEHILQFISNLQRQFQEHRTQHSSDQSQGTCSVPEGSTATTSNPARRLAVQKYLQKRKNRDFKKKVRYESRKRLAETRPRIRGQFVRQEVAAAYALVATASSGQRYRVAEDDEDEDMDS